MIELVCIRRHKAGELITRFRHCGWLACARLHGLGCVSHTRVTRWGALPYSFVASLQLPQDQSPRGGQCLFHGQCLLLAHRALHTRPGAR